MKLRISTLLFAAATLALAAGFDTSRTSAAPAARTATAGWVETAKQRLSHLDVKAAGPMSSYSRAKFGPAWQDVDLNGCDTRNDVLARDLKQVVLKAGSSCTVAKGTLHDRYTDGTINFVRGPGTSPAVQIDHVVALAAAWRTGAKQWTGERRLFYANDGLVLLAVDGPTNGAKSDSDAADWLPPKKSYHCRYVAKQIAIKTKYELWVTQPEKMTMTQVLGGC
jgi:hypothetical protein